MSALEGTVSWVNPYLSLAFGSLAKIGPHGSISTDITHPAGVGFGEPNLFRTSYTLRNIEPTSVPEGQQELALLSLGLLGFASLLKKKLASYLQANFEVLSALTASQHLLRRLHLCRINLIS